MQLTEKASGVGARKGLEFLEEQPKGDGEMKRVWGCLVLLAVVVLVLAGCGGEETGGGAGAGKEARGDIRIEVVTHGTAGDPFWSVVKNGVDQAAKDMGVEVNYRAPDTFDVVEIQRNLDAAIASKPDGIALTVVDPDALGDTVRKAADEGIPVVVLNTGQADWEKLGALAYVGQTEFEAGVEAGERMADEGVTSALCFNQEQGNIALDQRCDGFEKGLGGSVKQIAIEGTNPTAAQNGIETALRQNPDANGMLTLGPQGAEPALKALGASDSEIAFGTFDLGPSVLKAVRDGKILFAIDQQQYLQGYLPIVMLTNYVQYGVVPVGEVRTGPAFVTKENAARVIKLSEQGIR
jgi:simple sugar transport system substrate-binding protein